MGGIQCFEGHCREKFFRDGQVVLVDVFALRTLDEKRVAVPGPLTWFVGKTAKVGDRSPNDVEWNLELERACGGIQVGQEKRSCHWVLVDDA